MAGVLEFAVAVTNSVSIVSLVANVHYIVMDVFFIYFEHILECVL